jgi:hypothetical protein
LPSAGARPQRLRLACDARVEAAAAVVVDAVEFP